MSSTAAAAAEPEEIDPQVHDTLYGDPLRAPSEYELAVLSGLQRRPHVYQGTVDPVTVAQRRTRNKAGRRARRINRRKP